MAALTKHQMMIYREQPYRVLELTSTKKFFQTKWEIQAENLLTHHTETFGPFTNDGLEKVSACVVPKRDTVGCIQRCSETEVCYSCFDNGFKEFTFPRKDCAVDLVLKRKRIYTLSFLGKFLIAATLEKDTDGPIPADLVKGQRFLYEDRPYQVIATREYQGRVHPAWEITAKNLLDGTSTKLSGLPDSELSRFGFAFPPEQRVTVNLAYESEDSYEFMDMDTYEMISVPFGDCKTSLQFEPEHFYTLVFLDRFLIDAE